VRKLATISLLALICSLGIVVQIDVASGATNPTTVRYSQVSVYDNYGCALLTDGSVVCADSVGNASSPLPTLTSESVAVSGISAVKVIVWGTAGCALMSNQTIKCWNEISDPPSFSDFIDIQAGVCGLRSSGQIVCWSSWGNAPTNYSPSFTYTSLSSSWNTDRCALTDTNSIQCLGYWDHPYGSVPTFTAPVVQIAAGRSSECAVDANGLMKCWAGSLFGTVNGVKQVSIGESLGCYINTSNQVACQLTFGGSVSWMSPASSLENISSISVGHREACGVTMQGQMSCWGPNAPKFPVVRIAPSAPTVNLPTSPGPGQLTWTWSATSDGGSPITSYTWTGACAGSGNDLTITCSGLTAGANYTLNVTATNAYGTSSASSSSGVMPGVTAPSTTEVSVSSASAISGVLVVGYSATQIGQFLIHVDGGQVTLSPMANVTKSSINNGDGSDDLILTGTVTDINSALQSLKGQRFLNSSFTIYLGFTPAPAGYFFNPSNGHWYLPVSQSLNWSQADAYAKNLSFEGQPGYLVQPRSMSDMNFVHSLTPSSGMWLGGFATNSCGTSTLNAASICRSWKWSGGPLDGVTLQECSNLYFACNITYQTGFTNWNSGEPNNGMCNGCSDETAMATWWYGLTWNDAPTGASTSFIVEFGEMTNTASGNFGFDLASTLSATIFSTLEPKTPTVYPPTSTSSGQLTWTWSPNATGGSAISSYSWSGACSGSGFVTTVTCSGLTGGTNYTLSVAATNAVGTSGSGSRSGTALTYPGAPTGNASPANGALSVTWTTPSSNGGTAITGYTATATASGHSYSCTSTTLSCTIAGLTNGMTYSVSVVATNAKGNSTPSTTVSIYPAPDTKFLAYAPNSVVLVKANFQVLVANAKVGSLVTVTAAGATKTCTANAVGECSVTLNSAKSAGWVIVASYVDGKKTVSTATSYRVNIANITVSSVQVAKGKSFTVKISSGAPNTKFQVATSDGTSYSVNLTSAGAGTITVATKTKGTLTLTISDNGTLLQTTTVAVV